MIRTTLAALAAAAMILPATGVLAAQVQINATGPVVEMSVYETIEVAPDIATVSAGVSTEARTAVAAMRQNSVEMRRVIARIKALGVADRDIQTTGIRLNAQFDYDRENRRQVFRGYQVSNRVSVKLRDIDKTGEVLDALVIAGATDLSGPSFSVDDDSAAQAEARTRALTRARGQAMTYAGVEGYSGLRLLEISETIRGSGPVPVMARSMMAADAVENSAPVQPGMVTSGVSLTVKYELVN